MHWQPAHDPKAAYQQIKIQKLCTQSGNTFTTHNGSMTELVAHFKSVTPLASSVTSHRNYYQVIKSMKFFSSGNLTLQHVVGGATREAVENYCFAPAITCRRVRSRG